MLLPDAYSGHGGLMAASREQRHFVGECWVGDEPALCWMLGCHGALE
jgi:hypothetical protein